MAVKGPSCIIALLFNINRLFTIFRCIYLVPNNTCCCQNMTQASLIGYHYTSVWYMCRGDVLVLFGILVTMENCIICILWTSDYNSKSNVIFNWNYLTGRGMLLDCFRRGQGVCTFLSTFRLTLRFGFESISVSPTTTVDELFTFSILVVIVPAWNISPAPSRSFW